MSNTTAKKATTKKSTVKKTGVKKMTEATATEATELTPIQMCEQMHEKGMGQDEMILALTKHANLSVMKAVAAYKKFQKSAGLVESPAEKKRKADEAIEGFVTEEGSIDVKGAIEAIVDVLDVSASSAKSRIKKYCKENDIEMPAGVTRTAVTANDDQKELIVTSRKGGDKKADTIAKLMEKWTELEEKTAKRMYTKVSREAGLTSVRTAADHVPVIAWLKEHGEEYATKTGFITELQKVFPDMAPSATRKYWVLYDFVKQFNA